MIKRFYQICHSHFLFLKHMLFNSHERIPIIRNTKGLSLERWPEQLLAFGKSTGWI